MDFIEWFNRLLVVLFFLCYAYQFAYIPIAWLRRPRVYGPGRRNRFAFLIAAQKQALFVLHSVSIFYQGKAWLFSGSSGT